MEFKEPKLFGVDEDGFYLARIENISGRSECDTLQISNRKQNFWVFSLFNGYRQIGCFSVKNPHNFFIGQDVIVEKKDGKIVSVSD